MQGAWGGSKFISLMTKSVCGCRLALAARLLTGLRAYLVPAPDAKQPPQASPRGHSTSASRRRSRLADARTGKGQDVSVRLRRVLAVAPERLSLYFTSLKFRKPKLACLHSLHSG